MKKNKILGSAVILVLIAVTVGVYLGLSHDDSHQDDYTLNINPSEFQNGSDIFITPEELQTKLGSSNLVILDASHPKHYAGSHIPGAINIGFKGFCRSQGRPGDPLWGTILPKDELTEKLQSLGITHDSLVVAYSDTFKGPGAGGRAVWQLRMAGLANVKLLYGGLPVWRKLGYDLTSEVPSPSPSSGLVLSDYDETHRATLEFIKTNLGDIPLIDVRTRAEFVGDDTSRGEARGGHIQGAKWLEWTKLLKADGTPKSPQVITAIMAELGVTPQDDLVLY